MKALGIVLIIIGVITVPLSCGVLFATSFATPGVNVLPDTEVPLGTRATFKATAIEGVQGIGLTLVAPGAASDIDVDVDIAVHGTRSPQSFKLNVKRGASDVNVYQPYAPPGTTAPDQTNFFWRSPALDVTAGSLLTLDVTVQSKGAVTPSSARININGTPPFPKLIFIGAVGVPLTLIFLGFSFLIRSRAARA